MKKLICAGIAVIGLALVALSQTVGVDNYAIQYLGSANGGTSTLAAATTNTYTVAVDKQDTYGFQFSGLVSTNGGLSNTVTIRVYNKISQNQPAHPTAAWTSAIAVDTNHTASWITNISVGAIGYQVIVVENPGSLLTNAVQALAFKPKRSGRD